MNRTFARGLCPGGTTMNKLSVVLVIVFSLSGLCAFAEPATGRVLYVYDETNEQSQPYIAHFRAALQASGRPFNEAAAGELAGKDLSPYDFIVIHGMVMAFNAKSPVRDWLKKHPDLTGKKVSLFVTANRWFLDNLFDDLQTLLEKDKANVIDAVSMATKTTTDADEAEAVAKLIGRLK